MASFIATPKLLLYSKNFPKLQDSPLVLKQNSVFSILWCYWQLQKTDSGVLLLATIDEQTSDNLHTFRWENFIKP
jgi:hypothetical protein